MEANQKERFRGFRGLFRGWGMGKPFPLATPPRLPSIEEVMSQLVGKRITLGVTGSIAAYKAADLTSQLVKYGAEVQVVMTKGATQFITMIMQPAISAAPSLKHKSVIG